MQEHHPAAALNKRAAPEMKDMRILVDIERLMADPHIGMAAAPAA